MKVQESDGILVFMRPEGLEHKKRDGKTSEEAVCYWHTSKIPKKFVSRPVPDFVEYLDKEFKLYVALRPEGKVFGYFNVVDIDSKHDGIELWFHSESWTPIENGEIVKPSQGWRYWPR